MNLAIIGMTIFVAIFFVGFIRVDEAAWLAWRAAWILGGGAGMGIGLGLVIVGLLTHFDDRSRLRAGPGRETNHTR